MSSAMPIDPRDQLDFEPTQPPGLADGIAVAFGPLGIESVCASVVDTDPMTFESCWRITERGGSIQAVPAREPEGGLPAAMATIVQLTHLPDDQIVTRRLDACRWAFAWRIDEHRVAVAEANYRVARNEQTHADSAGMRLICETGIRAGSADSAEAVNDHSSAPVPLDRIDSMTTEPLPGPSARPALVTMQSGGVPFAQAAFKGRTWPERRTATADQTEVAARGGPRWTHRTLALAVLSVYLGTAALITLAHRDNAALQGAAAQLQARADATMLQRVDETLARGDYGEVQHELDQLAALKHFVGAVVTNARGRTVAMAGEVRDVRMGEVLTAEVSATGRLLPLTTTGGSAQLLLWDVERAQPRGTLAGSSTLIMGLSVCAGATIAALLIARRQRRSAVADRLHRRDQS